MYTIVYVYIYLYLFVTNILLHHFNYCIVCSLALHTILINTTTIYISVSFVIILCKLYCMQYDL